MLSIEIYRIRAFLNDVILINFIDEIMIEIEIMLFKIQFLFENIHPRRRLNPINKDMKSIIRKGKNFRLIKALNNSDMCNLNINSFMQTTKARRPIIQMITIATISAAFGKNRRKVPPITKSKLQNPM